jgi:hypothetical protein
MHAPSVLGGKPAARRVDILEDAAFTDAALSTGLRECQCKGTDPVTVG